MYLENLPENRKKLWRKGRKREEKGEKRGKKGKREEKGEKKREKEIFLWNCMSSSTSRHAERVAPKAPRGAKNLCRFGLGVQHYTGMNSTQKFKALVSFEAFLKWIIKNKGQDKHFTPMHVICNPCLMNYDMVTKLETADVDSDYIQKILEFFSFDFSFFCSQTEEDTIKKYRFSFCLLIMYQD